MLVCPTYPSSFGILTWHLRFFVCVCSFFFFSLPPERASHLYYNAVFPNLLRFWGAYIICLLIHVSHAICQTPMISFWQKPEEEMHLTAAASLQNCTNWPWVELQLSLKSRCCQQSQGLVLVNHPAVGGERVGGDEDGMLVCWRMPGGCYHTWSLWNERPSEEQPLRRKLHVQEVLFPWV